MSTSDDVKRVEALLHEAISKGWVEMVLRAGGRPGYRITELGKEHLDRVINGEEDD